MSLTEGRWFVDVPVVPPKIDGVLSVATRVPLAAGAKALVGAEYQTDACNPEGQVWPGGICDPVDLTVAPCVDPPALATGATAGTPGSWTGGAAPTRQMVLSGQLPVTASPLTAWTINQRVVTSDGYPVHWDGSSWQAGIAQPTLPPTVSTVTPNSMPASPTALTLTVTGTRFVANSGVRVAGGAALATTFVSATQLTAQFTPTNPGTYQIIVRNPGPVDSNQVPVTVTAAAEFDPNDHTIPEVQAHVENLPKDASWKAKVQRIIDLERAGKNRVTLVTWLDELPGVS